MDGLTKGGREWLIPLHPPSISLPSLLSCQRIFICWWPLFRSASFSFIPSDQPVGKLDIIKDRPLVSSSTNTHALLPCSALSFVHSAFHSRIPMPVLWPRWMKSVQQSKKQRVRDNRGGQIERAGERLCALDYWPGCRSDKQKPRSTISTFEHSGDEAHPGQNTSSTHVNTATARESLEEEMETLYKFDVKAGTVCALLCIAN